MAEDLQRFITDEPVLARQISAAEQCWRWCKRNPAVAGAVATVATALTAVAVVAVLYAGRERKIAADQIAATGKITRLATDLEGERGKLRKSLQELSRQLASQQFQRGQVAFEKGDIGPGLPGAGAGKSRRLRTTSHSPGVP